MKGWISSSEATHRWGLGVSTIRNAINRGRFAPGEYQKMGRDWAVQEDAVERLYGEPKIVKVTVDGEVLRDWLEKLYRRAIGFARHGGETQLYANYDDDGELGNFHFVDFPDHSHWQEGRNLVCVAICRWFDPMSDEDFDEWWENHDEKLLKQYPDWRDFAAEHRDKWEGILDEWRDIWMDTYTAEWVETQVEKIEQDAKDQATHGYYIEIIGG